MCGKSACTVRRGEGSKSIDPSYPYRVIVSSTSSAGKRLELSRFLENNVTSQPAGFLSASRIWSSFRSITFIRSSRRHGKVSELPFASGPASASAGGFASWRLK